MCTINTRNVSLWWLDSIVTPLYSSVCAIVTNIERSLGLESKALVMVVVVNGLKRRLKIMDGVDI